ALLDVLRADPAVRRRRLIGLGLAGTAIAGTLVVSVALRSHDDPPWRAAIRDLTVYEENSDAAAISPDGKLLAYPSDREGDDSMRIYVEPLEGGAPRAITPPKQAALCPRWSADSSKIAYIDEHTSIATEVPIA